MMDQTVAAKGDLDRRGRVKPPASGDEFETLSGFLEYQRGTFRWKCRGLNSTQLRQRLEPTDITLAGLLTHLARVEHGWFHSVVARQPAEEPWASMERAPGEWLDHGLSAEGLRDRWEREVARSRQILTSQVAAGDFLSEVHEMGSRNLSLRWIMVHLVGEYARHNGHADLLRESIDGEVGD